MFVTVFLVWLLLMIIYYNVSRTSLYRLSRKIPGPKAYPLFGNALQFLGPPNKVMKKLYGLSMRYTRLVGMWLGPKFYVLLYDPREIEVVLKATRQVEKAEEYRLLRPWLGDSILLSSGLKFKKNKKLVMPGFHPNILKEFMPYFNHHAQQLVKAMQCEIGQPAFDFHHYLHVVTLNVLLETALGVSVETLGRQTQDYARGIDTICKIIHLRCYKLHLRPDFLFNMTKHKKEFDEAIHTVHSLTDKVIQQRKAELNSKRLDGESETTEITEGRRKTAFMDVLLEASRNGEGMTDIEIRDEVLTVMFAGQDTTAVTLGFLMSLLGTYRKIQDRVVQELEEVFGNSSRPVTLEDLPRLEYLERCIQETWRLYPSIPLIGRKPKIDIPLEECVIPKESTIVIITMLLHRNPKYFPNPHLFNPDNFLPERAKERHPYSFIPFSAGHRMCIGGKYAMMEIKVCASTLLRNYLVLSPKKEKEFVLMGATTLKRKDGFLITVTPRENAPHLNPNAAHDPALNCYKKEAVGRKRKGMANKIIEDNNNIPKLMAG